MSAELLPCPFCGGSAEFASIDDADSDDFGGEFIQCIHHACAASSMLIFPTMADAKPLLIEKWNRRPPASSERVALSTDSADLEELRFYRRHGFPYIDHSTMFQDDHAGFWAIKLIDSTPSEDGTCIATVLRAFTVEQLYDDAKQHVAKLETAHGIAPRPDEATGQINDSASGSLPSLKESDHG